MSRRRMFVAIAALSLLITSACRRQGGAPAAPRQLTATQVADRAKPATVQIVVLFDATVEVPVFAISSEKLTAQVRAAGANTAKRADLWNAFLGNPRTFLTADSTRRSAKKRVVATGSGLILTPDGYAATNAHVVNPDEDTLKSAVIESIKEWVASDVAKFETAVARELPGSSIQEDAQKRLAVAIATFYAQSARLSDVKSEVLVLIPRKRGSKLEVEKHHADVKKVGKAFPGKDVAIIKIEGHDLPTLPLAPILEAGEVRTGSPLFVVGYPGVLLFNDTFSETGQLESTMTMGHVSAIRDMAEGWKVVQTDAAINHGNSGGPALDESGRVVGLATANVIEKGAPAQGLNLVVSVNVMREYLNELNVKPSESEFTHRYVQALEAFERQDKRAAGLFRLADEVSPGLPAVQEFLQRTGDTDAPSSSSKGGTPAERRPDAEQTRRRSSPALLVAGVLVVAILGLGGVILANRARY